MIISNPSVLFLRAPDINDVRRTLTGLEEAIGVAETQNGNVPLKVSSSGRIRRIPFSGESITDIERGLIVCERKIRLNYDPPYDVVEPYRVNYYLVSSSQGDMLQIVASKSVTSALLRVLRRRGAVINLAVLSMRVQEALLSRGDFIFYGIDGANQRERVGGRVRATTRSPTTSIERSTMVQFVRGLGSEQNHGLTWIGMETRPNLTFWIYKNGRVLIRNPNVQEEWMLALIDLVMSKMP